MKKLLLLFSAFVLSVTAAYADGTNLLTNSSFEQWEDKTPTAWKSTTTASNATLSQSTDAYSGSYSVCVAGNASNNKRLASKEYTLSAGTYTMKAYVKGEGQVRMGYVPVTDGKVGTYMYANYATTSADEWTEVSYEFTLEETTVVNLVLMNPKTSKYATASDKLVDDFTLTTSDGGSETPDPEPGVDISNTPETAYTVAKANELIAAGEGLDSKVYVKGIIVSVKEVSTSYGNATYYISDDGTENGQLTVYRGYALNGNKFTSEDEIQDGDEVIVYGKLVNYNGTYEFTTGSQIYSLNGTTTGIAQVNAEGAKVNGIVYSIDGRRLTKLVKGVNIVNGKKIVVK